jgi:anti-sigma B factor antagonist
LTYDSSSVYFFSYVAYRVNVSATSEGCYITSDARPFQVPTIEVRSPQPHAALVVLAGEHDLYSADEVQQTFDQSLAVCDHLIIDLSTAEFIDSTIVGVLLQTKKNAVELDRKFNVVLGTAPAVKRILEVTGVVPLLNIVPTVERALAA